MFHIRSRLPLQKQRQTATLHKCSRGASSTGRPDSKRCTAHFHCDAVMTEQRSSDCEVDTEDVDTTGNSQSAESIAETSSMPATQASSTTAPVETEDDGKNGDEARTDTSAAKASRQGNQQKQNEGAIDLERLMNTIEMTRVSTHTHAPR